VIVARRRRIAPPLKPQPEAVLQRQVIQLAQVYGWRVYFTYRSKHSPAGWPDLVLVKPPHMYIWELKADEGRLTPAQSTTLHLLGGCTELSVAVRRPRDWETICEELAA